MKASLKEERIAEAVDFLSTYHQDRPIHLAAIIPDGGIVARTIDPGNTAELDAFLMAHEGHKNIYFHVNPLKSNCKNKKGAKADVSEAVCVHVDIDDLSQMAVLREFVPPPTAVVMSGGGYNAYWKLRNPSNDFNRVELVNQFLVDSLGGDAAAKDISRILRVPGTTNIPTKKKRERGREAVEATVVEDMTDWSRSYDLDDFPLARVHNAHDAPVESGSEEVAATELPSGLGSRLERVAIMGDDPDEPRSSAEPRYRSRSEAVFAIACALARLGQDAESIAGVLVNPDLGISASVLEKPNPIEYALRQARQAQMRVSDQWPEGIDRQERPTRTYLNAQAALLRCGCSFSFDAFRNKFIVSGQIVQSYSGELNDQIVSLLRDHVGKTFNFDPGKEHTRDALEFLCNANPCDPVREFLVGLKWDGQKRLATWLVDFAGAEDTEFVRAVSRLVLVAAVRRVLKPGSKFDTVLVLEGIQGTGKSSLIQVMASDEFYSDQDILAFDARTQVEALEGVWLYELSELAGMKHTDKNKIKAFVSRSKDRARPAYARYAVDRPRRCIFIGTTNDDEYLKDETGNRRFWPVRTGEIDLEGLRECRDQLWAEAVHRENNGESIVLPKSLWGVAAVEQSKRLEVDGWEPLLEDLCGVVHGGWEYVLSREVMENAIGLGGDRIQRYHWNRLGRALRGLGWEGPMTVNLPSRPATKGFRRPPKKDQYPI